MPITMLKSVKHVSEHVPTICPVYTRGVRASAGLHGAPSHRNVHYLQTGPCQSRSKARIARSRWPDRASLAVSGAPSRMLTASWKVTARL